MTIKKLLKNKFKQFMKSDAVIRLVARMIVFYTRFIGKTCHWEMRNIEKILDKLNGQNAIWVGWHARVTMLPFFWQSRVKRPMSALVSPHQDGKIIANFLHYFDISPVNGSTNENARQSALELMRALQKGDDLFISPDGPRGPRMRMKKSPIYYAQKTGKPIICVCFCTSPAIVVDKAWDKTFIPLPFTQGMFMLSDPLYVPENLSDEEFEQYRLKLEKMANDLLTDCDKAVGRTPICPAEIDEIKVKRKKVKKESK